MTDQDNLRDRIKQIIDLHDERFFDDDYPSTLAQAIIDELGLTVETHAATQAKRTMTRITSNWEWEN